MTIGNFADAIQHFQKSIKQAPHFKTLELLGECMLLSGSPLASIVPLAAAVGLGSNEFRALYLLAKAYAAVGEHRNGLKYVERALRIKPDFKKAQELRIELAADLSS